MLSNGSIIKSYQKRLDKALKRLRYWFYLIHICNYFVSLESYDKRTYTKQFICIKF